MFCKNKNSKWGWKCQSPSTSTFCWQIQWICSSICVILTCQKGREISPGRKVHYSNGILLCVAFCLYRVWCSELGGWNVGTEVPEPVRPLIQLCGGCLTFSQLLSIFHLFLLFMNYRSWKFQDSRSRPMHFHTTSCCWTGVIFSSWD